MSDSLTGRRSLSETVFDRIQRSIKSGAYAVDERLPTE
ncbi:MAG: GntR family transcriptional regulator, partial [Devosia sp.]